MSDVGPLSSLVFRLLQWTRPGPDEVRPLVSDPQNTGASQSCVSSVSVSRVSWSRITRPARPLSGPSTWDNLGSRFEKGGSRASGGGRS